MPRPVPAPVLVRTAQPEDPAATLRWAAAHATPGVEVVDEAGYRRVVGDRVVALRHVEGGWSLESDDPAADLAAARRVVAADDDPAAVVAALGGDDVLGPLLRARPGLRVAGGWDPWQVLVCTVLGQQVSVAGARTLAGRLVALAGSPLAQPLPGLTRAFPTAEQLLAADLTGLGLTRARAAALHAVAAAVAAGDVDLAAPGAATDLLAVRGVGPWTAQYVALRALGDRDAWPGSDLVLARRLEELGLRQADARRWSPYRAHAAVHLWEEHLERQRQARDGR